VAHDDQGFLMMRETSAGESGALVMNENWFEELQARAQWTIRAVAIGAGSIPCASARPASTYRT
jgi:hypothetical protein